MLLLLIRAARPAPNFHRSRKLWILWRSILFLRSTQFSKLMSCRRMRRSLSNISSQSSRSRALRTPAAVEVCSRRSLPRHRFPVRVPHSRSRPHYSPSRRFTRLSRRLSPPSHSPSLAFASCSGCKLSRCSNSLPTSLVVLLPELWRYLKISEWLIQRQALSLKSLIFLSFQLMSS